MDILQQYSQSRFMDYVPNIKKQPQEWFMVDVAMTGMTNHNSSYIALKLREYFGGNHGIIFICNTKNVLALVHMGKGVNGNSISKGLDEKMPRHSCTTQIEDATPDGLIKICIRLEELEMDNKKSQSGSAALLSTRRRRTERVVMVVDDDMMMRSLISKTFRTRSRVIEFKDTDKVLEAYLEYLPDIVLLDIHLPSGSGIGVLQEILEFDETAYVIILSSDSVKDNILDTKEFGAKGFIGKPFTLEQLESCYKKCPTVIGWK